MGFIVREIWSSVFEEMFVKFKGLIFGLRIWTQDPVRVRFQLSSLYNIIQCVKTHFLEFLSKVASLLNIFILHYIFQFLEHCVKKAVLPRTCGGLYLHSSLCIIPPASLTSAHWWNILLAWSCIRINLRWTKGWDRASEVPRLGLVPAGSWAFIHEGQWPRLHWCTK